MGRTLGLLLVAALLAGCGSPAQTASPAVTSPPAPLPASPSPAPPSTASTAPSTAATASPAPSPAASPSPTAAPSPSVTRVAGDLVARLVVLPDVWVSPVVADLSVYDDGTVLTPGWRSTGFEGTRFTVRRLTPAGLAAVRAAFDGAVVRVGQVGTVQPATEGQGRGFSTYQVTARRGSELVTAWTTNASAGTGVASLIAFGDRWLAPEAALPAGAWAAATPVPYVPAYWSASVDVSAGCCAEPGRPSDAVVVPALGPLDAFGALVVADPPFARCAVIDWRTRGALGAALATAGIDLGDGLDRSDVTLNHGDGMTTLTVVPMLPEANACVGPGSGTSVPSAFGLPAPDRVAAVKSAVPCPGASAGAGHVCGVSALVSWRPRGTERTAFRIYTTSAGAGAGATCLAQYVLPLTTTKIGATSVRVGPIPLETGGGMRCLYVAAVVGDVESPLVRVPGDFQGP